MQVEARAHTKPHTCKYFRLEDCRILIPTTFLTFFFRPKKTSNDVCGQIALPRTFQHFSYDVEHCHLSATRLQFLCAVSAMSLVMVSTWAWGAWDY
jgi:hypothetical protein